MTDNEALDRLVARFDAKIQKRVAFASKFVYQNIKNGHNLASALSTLNKTMPEIFNIFGLRDALIEAAAYGYGIMPSMLTSADRKNIADAIEEPWSADGMRLSEKLHTASKVMHQAIMDTVTDQINKNRTAIQIARELYDGYNSGKAVIRQQEIPQYLTKIIRAQGTRDDNKDIRRALEQVHNLAKKGAPNKSLRTAYNELIEAIEAGNDRALRRSIHTAIQEKSRYVAERIARTEMARAYSDGFFNKHQKDPDVIGYQIELGTRHPVFDICDVYAECNMFNLGAGVYPKDQVPMVPIHPHCLCKYHVLYRTQLDMSKQNDRGNAALKEYLDKLTYEERKQLLGVAGANRYQVTGKAALQDVRGWQDLQAPKVRGMDIKTKKPEKEPTKAPATPQGAPSVKQPTVEFSKMPQFFKVNKPTTDNAVKIIEHLNSVKASDASVVELWSRFSDLDKVTFYNWKITHSQKGGQAGFGDITIPKITKTNIVGGKCTIFHEFGHAIDNIIGSSKSLAAGAPRFGMSEQQRWYSCQFKPLDDALQKLRAECFDSASKKTTIPDKYLAPFKELEKQAKAEKSKYNNKLRQLNKDLTDGKIDRKTYDKLWKEYELARSEAPRNIMGGWAGYSDIIDAVTDGYARETDKVWYGHGASYYKNPRNKYIETVANYNNIAINSPEVYTFMQQNMPELVQALQEYEKALLKELDALVKNK